MVTKEHGWGGFVSYGWDYRAFIPAVSEWEVPHSGPDRCELPGQRAVKATLIRSPVVDSPVDSNAHDPKMIRRFWPPWDYEARLNDIA